MSKCIPWGNMISGYKTCVDFRVNFDIFEVRNVWRSFSENNYLKNDIFKICLRQSAKCKMTAHTPRENIICLSTSGLYTVFYNQNLDFKAPTYFSLSLSNQFILQVVCFLYVEYISNISPIYPIYSICWIHSIHSVIKSYIWIYFCHISCAGFLPPTVWHVHRA